MYPFLQCFLAQEEGFEPPWAFTQTVFKNLKSYHGLGLFRP